jgi:hypothetical protein
MCAWATGARSQVLIDWESVYGTAPTGSAIAAIKLPFVSCDLKDDSKPQPTVILGGGRNVAPAFYPNTSFAGTLTGYCDSIAIGYILRAIFGAPTTTGSASAYTHTFKIASTTPSFVLEKGHPDIPYYYLYKGCKATGFSVTLAQNGQFQYTVPLIAASQTASSSSYDATPSIDVSKPTVIFDAQDLAVTEGGGAITTVDQLSFNFMNNSVVGFGLGGGGSATVAGEGNPTINGTLRGMFDGNTIIAKGTAKTESSLVATMTRSTVSLSLAVDELFYSRETPAISGPGGVMIDLTFEGFYSNDADASAFRAVLVNATASYA